MGFLNDKHGVTLLGQTPPGTCPICATKHEPEQPHNQQSLAYQYKFYDEHGRWPTWADAMAHCSDMIRDYWTRELEKRGIKVNGEEEKKQYKPKVVKGRVKNTGYPIDGCVMLFSLWDYDNHDSWHLYGWDDIVDDAVMRTIHQTDELYKDDDLKEFSKMWKAGEYEPAGSFCLNLDELEVIEVLQEEEKP